MYHDDLKRPALWNRHSRSKRQRSVGAKRTARAACRKLGIVEGPLVRAAIQTKLLGTGWRTVHCGKDGAVGIRHSSVVGPLGR